MRFYDLLLTGKKDSIHFDEYFSALDDRRVGLDRDHAGRRHHLAGLDVELAVVEVALDHVAIDEALRQRARTMGAGVIGDEELAVEIEDREREAGSFHFQRIAGGDLFDLAELYTCRHGFSCGAGTGRIDAGTMFRIEELRDPS